MDEDSGAKTRKDLSELWKREGLIKSETLIRAFIKVGREKFLPEKLREMAYADSDIRLDSDSVMLQQNTVIKVLEEADLKNNNKVLQIGSVTGYEEALITEMGMEVHVLEPRLEHIQRASANIGAACNNMPAPHYYRRIRDTNEHYDRIICFGTISSMDEKVMSLMEEGVMVLSVGEKHLLMRLEIKQNKSPILKFHGIVWMPLIGDEIFS
jgi:protein-L-isoaspartate(D-aspartate) O-methyltransferase